MKSVKFLAPLLFAAMVASCAQPNVGSVKSDSASTEDSVDDPDGLGLDNEDSFALLAAADTVEEVADDVSVDPNAVVSSLRSASKMANPVKVKIRYHKKSAGGFHDGAIAQDGTIDANELFKDADGNYVHPATVEAGVELLSMVDITIDDVEEDDDGSTQAMGLNDDASSAFRDAPKVHKHHRKGTATNKTPDQDAQHNIPAPKVPESKAPTVPSTPPAAQAGGSPSPSAAKVPAPANAPSTPAASADGSSCVLAGVKGYEKFVVPAAHTRFIVPSKSVSGQAFVYSAPAATESNKLGYIDNCSPVFVMCGANHLPLTQNGFVQIRSIDTRGGTQYIQSGFFHGSRPSSVCKSVPVTVAAAYHSNGGAPKIAAPANKVLIAPAAVNKK